MNESLRKRCNALLTVIVGEDYVDQWWDSPNKIFD